MSARWMPVDSRSMNRRSFAKLLICGASLLLYPRRGLAKSRRIIKVSTSGEAFERGRQQANQTRELYRAWIRRHLNDKAELFGLGSGEEFVRMHAADAEKRANQLAKTYPEGFQECRGLISGLGVDEATYFCGHYGNQFPPWLHRDSARCTTVGLRDEAGNPLVGKTDDAVDYELGMNVLEITRPSTGYRHVHFHFAGTIWTTAGMNESGLAMGMTGIPGKSTEQSGISSLEVLHTVLPSCGGVEEAIDHLFELRINLRGFSLLLGDSTGRMCVVEKNSEATVVLPEIPGRALIHTNEILNPGLASRTHSLGEPMRTNSRRRYENATRLWKAGKRVDEILDDRGDYGAISQQGQEDLYTDFAVVFSPAQKELRYWPGDSTSSQAEILRLDDLFG